AYKARLLADGTAAAEELGFGGNHLKAVENTPTVHNLVVCTLCSCYPWAILGLPPTWYKSLEYRARGVSEPRAVLREFGLELDDDAAFPWDAFRDRLIAEIARAESTGEGSSYYERWLAAFERLLVEQGLVDAAALDARTAELAARPPEADHH